MQLKTSEYKKLSDLYFLCFGQPFLKKMIRSEYPDEETLVKEVGEILDSVRNRWWEQNKKTAEFIKQKRKTNKNYARSKQKMTLKSELESIRKEIEAEKDLFMSEVVFLTAHQTEVKKYFPDDPVMWQWAGIPEEEFNNKTEREV